MTPKQYDVYGIGNALVDIEAQVDDSFLQRLKITKGFMTLIDEQRHFELLLELKWGDKRQSSGGSAANSMLAVAQLGGKAFYSCRVAKDEFGHFFVEDLLHAGIGCRENFYPIGDTGKCLVFVTPDGERTLNTYLGITQTFGVEDLCEEELAQAKYLYIEGYLLASPLGFQAALKAKEWARKYGVKTSITFSDPFIVETFRHRLQEVLDGGVDLVFCNKEEALAFGKNHNLDRAIESLQKVSKDFVVTLGGEGALVVQSGVHHSISCQKVKPVDTTGAGDMFAGVFLYGLTHGFSYSDAGKMASLASTKVVQKHGPRLSTPDLKTCLSHQLVTK